MFTSDPQNEPLIDPKDGTREHRKIPVNKRSDDSFQNEIDAQKRSALANPSIPKIIYKSFWTAEDRDRNNIKLGKNTRRFQQSSKKGDTMEDRDFNSKGKQKAEDMFKKERKPYRRFGVRQFVSPESTKPVPSTNYFDTFETQNIKSGVAMKQRELGFTYMTGSHVLGEKNELMTATKANIESRQTKRSLMTILVLGGIAYYIYYYYYKK